MELWKTLSGGQREPALARDYRLTITKRRKNSFGENEIRIF